jgi:hypothetical protein
MPNQTPLSILSFVSIFQFTVYAQQLYIQYRYMKILKFISTINNELLQQFKIF